MTAFLSSLKTPQSMKKTFPTEGAERGRPMQFDHWNAMTASGWREEDTHFLWQRLVWEEVPVLQNILCQARKEKKKSHTLI